MQPFINRYFVYYPVTCVKGEIVPFYMMKVRRYQWMSISEIRAIQKAALNKIVKYAVTNIPFYQDLYKSSVFQKQKEDIRIDDLSEMKLLPTIDKSDLIRQGVRMVRKNIFTPIKTTGGSTGEPVVLYKSIDALARERAATWRSYEWAGLKIGDPQLRFWGVPHTRSNYIKAKITDFVANRSRISAFAINEGNLNSYYKKAIQYRPKYIYGYVSAVELFAKFLADNRLTPPRGLKAVITTAELLSEGTRKIIQDSLGVRVFNEYGCGEVGSIAHECEHGNMHIMADNLIVEIDNESGYNNEGGLIITDLHNKAMPLIRYRVGDFGTLSNRECACGRGLPVLEKIYGREYDMITTSSGIKIHPESLIYVFEEIQSKTRAFKQFQAVQRNVKEIDVHIVVSSNFSDAIEKSLVENLKKKVDEKMTFAIIKVPFIEREKSGKMRVVKSLVNH